MITRQRITPKNDSDRYSWPLAIYAYIVDKTKALGRSLFHRR